MSVPDLDCREQPGVAGAMGRARANSLHRSKVITTGEGELSSPVITDLPHRLGVISSVGPTATPGERYAAGGSWVLRDRRGRFQIQHVGSERLLGLVQFLCADLLLATLGQSSSGLRGDRGVGRGRSGRVPEGRTRRISCPAGIHRPPWPSRAWFSTVHLVAALTDRNIDVDEHFIPLHAYYQRRDWRRRSSDRQSRVPASHGAASVAGDHEH